MKKTFISIFIISLLSITLLSCNFQFSGSSMLTKPDVEASRDHITISIPLQSADTSYINLYRKVPNEERIISLGIIYPSALNSTANAYIYTDYLITKDTTYIYQARYKESDGYYITEWSNEITAVDGYSINDSITYDKGSAFFVYDEDEYSLKIVGTISAPTSIADFEDNYKPMLIVNTSIESQLFELATIADSTTIPLKNYLPLNFLDTPITIVGITAGKQEYVDPEASEPVTKYIYWIEPTEMTIRGYSDKTFVIPSTDTAAGFDYSHNINTIN